MRDQASANIFLRINFQIVKVAEKGERKMTRKRYEGLMRALITNMMEDDKRMAKPVWKKGQRGVSFRSIKNLNVPCEGGFGSYQEAWDFFMPARELYGMADIRS